jgi:hypothetical protein
MIKNNINSKVYYMDYQIKYLKYKSKYINLRQKLQMAPFIPNPITNVSVIKPMPPTIPNPVSNMPIKM